MTIGDRIKSKRELSGLTQTELAKVIHSTKQTIYKYETNIITNVPYNKIVSIADALNTTPAFLMGWEKEEKIADGMSELLHSSLTQDIMEKVILMNDSTKKRFLRYANLLLDEQAENEENGAI